MGFGWQLEAFKTLRAGVQYNDFEGTAAADNADEIAIGNFLRKKGSFAVTTSWLAYGFWIGENQGGKVETPIIRVLYTKANGFDEFKEMIESNDGPLSLNEAEVELSLEEFFGLFKRFSVVLVWNRLDLIPREYEIKE